MMAKQAAYTRSTVGGEIVYDVRPASWSKAYVVMTAIVSLILLGFLGGLSLLLGPIAPVGLVIAGGVLWLIEWRHFVSSNRHRRPVKLRIAAGGIGVGKRQLLGSDIAEFEVATGWKKREPAATVTVAGGTGIAGTAAVTSAAFSTAGAQLGASMRRRQAERSYLLLVRAKDTSEPEVLVGGLTYDCARRLMDDVSSDLRSAGGGGQQ